MVCTHKAICCTHPLKGGLIVPSLDCGKVKCEYYEQCSEVKQT